MEWQILLGQFLRGVGWAAGLIISGGALFGAIEKIASPLKKYREQKDKENKQQQELIGLLKGWEGHLAEAATRDRRIGILEQRQEEQREDIVMSRDERKLMWQVLRTLVLTFRELVPADHIDARRELTQSLRDMDKFANERMRGEWDGKN